MATTSDGGKEDPPDPSKATLNTAHTAVPSISTPALRSAKNVLILTRSDPDIQYFVYIDEEDDALDSPNSPFPTAPSPPKTTGKASATPTVVSTTLPLGHTKNVPISSRTEPDLAQNDHILGHRSKPDRNTAIHSHNMTDEDMAVLEEWNSSPWSIVSY